MTDSRRQPPGPRLPRRVQALALDLAPLRFMEACRRRYGDIVMLRSVVTPTFVMVFDPELMKQVLQGPPVTVPAADPRVRQLLGEGSLAGLEAAEHLQRRRQLAPPFHGERMRAHAELIRDATDRAIDSWPTGEEFPLLPSLRSLTSEVTTAVLFGLDGRHRRDELIRRARALTRRVGPWPRLLGRSARSSRGRAPVDELLYEEIARHRAAPDRSDDVLSLLLLARDEDGRAMTDQEVCDQLVTLLIGGSDPTASGLAWAFELLLRHPATLERLETQLADGDDEYLDAVVKETLRLRPPVPHVTRVVRDEPYPLGEYMVLPGTEIRASLAAIHCRADEHPEPLAFRPERFLDNGQAGGFTWLPFGAGVHRCPGASFATFEMPIVIRRVLERRRLRPARMGPERAAHERFTQAPARGVRVITAAR